MSKGRRHLAVLAVAAFSGALGLVGPSAAQAVHHCPAGSEAAVSTINTSCAEAHAVLGKALKKLPLEKFRVFVHGWWHCFYTEIAGHSTFTAERKYGTPQRQVVIVVVE